VRVFSTQVMHARCSCSRDAVAGMLASFDPKDRAEMVENGKVVVTCEFCSSVYEFTPDEAGVVPATEQGASDN
jgi:molecular chaperone Hsp33